MAGGSNGGLEAYLPMAIALGATALTGGAAAPALLGAETLGLGAGTVGAGMLNAGLIGAGSSALGGIMQGQNGGDILKNSLISGGLGAGTAGILGGLGGEIPLAGPEPTNVGIDAIPSGTPAQAAPDLLTNPQARFDPNAYGSEIGTNPANAAKDVNFVPGTNVPGASNATSSLDKMYNPTGMEKYAPAVVGALATNNMFKQPGITPASTGGVPDALKFNFDKTKYKPAIAPYYSGIDSLYPQTPYAQQMRGYADGGTVEQMSRANSLGNNQMFPQSGIGGLTGANTYQNPTNTPMETSVIGPTDTMTNPYSGQMSFAEGGIMGYAKGGNLGSYSDGGRMLKGPGDGMSDDIPASIGNKQPARLADGEFVVPADVVSHLGNGSTDAGAKHLYSMMDKVRKARTGNPKQGKQINPSRYLTA